MMVDGFFISNYIGKTAFAAVNLIIPFLMILGGIGAMLGVGGSALVAKTLGEGDSRKAGRYFTMMMYLTVGTSVLCTGIGIIAVRPVARLFGATDNMIADVVLYGSICLLFNLALQAQYTFQSFLVAAEKPEFAFAVVIASGIRNMVPDLLLMAVLKLGIAGAAPETGLSQCVASVIPFIWLLGKKKHLCAALYPDPYRDRAHAEILHERRFGNAVQGIRIDHRYPV